MIKGIKKLAVIFGISLIMIGLALPQIENVHAQMYSNILPPLQQVNSGTAPQDVKCIAGLVLVLKAEDGSPACVQQPTADVLTARGWAKLASGISNPNQGSGQTPAITLGDNGKTIQISKGDRFLLKLGNGYTWSLDIDNQTVVSRVPNIMVVEGAQGLYEAHNSGQAILTATGDPACLSSIPACGMPSILFKLTIAVG
ncbi:MAG: hypothetical protein ACYDAJ_10050 [Nitrosotalea sp.]